MKKICIFLSLTLLTCKDNTAHTSVTGEWGFASIVPGLDNLSAHFVLNEDPMPEMGSSYCLFFVNSLRFSSYAVSYGESRILLGLSVPSPGTPIPLYKGYLIIFNPKASPDFNTITTDSVIYSTIDQAVGYDSSYRLVHQKRTITIKRRS